MSDSQHPRKPFNARGAYVIRCEACQMPEVACLCPYRSKVKAKAEFALLTHPREFYKPTNTGRLIDDVVQGTQTFKWHRIEQEQGLKDLLADRQKQVYIVFPRDDDYVERMATPQTDPNITNVFMILDGTWRQARRAFRHSDYLKDLPIVDLETPAVSQYKLRKAEQDHHLCTAEVAIGLLQQIDDEHSAQVLAAYFGLFNGLYAKARKSFIVSPEEMTEMTDRLIAAYEAHPHTDRAWLKRLIDLEHKRYRAIVK
ncbi:MAG: tRNA-uridine aminocarboxypropyltransferase [Pontibacterium sp.]